MSGHSKWSTIKHKKALRDHKRGDLFTKAAKNITVAVRKGGSPDPEANFSLRLAVSQARALNMPKDNIERAIRKGTGGGEGELEELILEAYGPGGVGILIEVVTDSRNRAVAELKNILEKNEGRLGTPGSVMYQFEPVVTIRLGQDLGEELQLELIDRGASAIENDEGGWVVTVDQARGQELVLWLKSRGFEDPQVEALYKSKTKTLQHRGVEGLVESLLSHEDVREVYTT